MENYDYLFEMQETEPAGGVKLAPFDKEEYKARKQAEREGVYGMIDETVARMQGDGYLFQGYLDVQARFDRYSVSNAILITAQEPEAIGPFKAFDDWKAERVSIKRGETAIALLEPGKEYLKEDGSPAMSYNVKKVFDLSQTNSQVRSTPRIVRDERLLLKSLISHAPCEMKISDNLSDRMNAVYSPDEKTIYVRQGMDAPDIFRALASELAHAHMDKGDEYKRSENVNTATCVAYILCKRYGVSVDVFSFDRLPEQYSKMDPQEFRKELSKIRDIAGEISRDMNRVLEAQDRSKKERSGEAR